MGIPTFQGLKKNLKKNDDALKRAKVAILGDTATQLFSQAVRGYGYEFGFSFEVFEADFDQIDMQVLDPESELYAFDASYIIIYKSVVQLLNRFGKTPLEQRSQFAQQVIIQVESYIQSIAHQTPAKILLSNFPEITDAVFGNYGNKVDSSWIYQLRKLNFLLMELAASYDQVFINDLVSLQNVYGREFVFDPKIYVNTNIDQSLDFLPVLAKNTSEIIRSLEGQVKKCLILDLDNTTWGGIIGDDGMDKIQIGSLGIGKAFTELQLWAKNLKERGILLAVCSKNTESIAKEPFEKHSDMLLRLEDIAVFVANWENKADNIRHIQSILNIGFDSMVFLDDNPFERNLVRSELPAVDVPELPEDPAEYMSFLRRLNLFETGSYSTEDAGRTQKYQVEASRQQLQKSFTSLKDYLANLDMKGKIELFDEFHIPRVAQLTQRSNQFNLRTIRYSENEIRQIMDSQHRTGLYVTLEDRFGSHGLISLVILDQQGKDLFIDTWIMSCRVLKRGVETFVLNAIVAIAKEKGVERLLGEYIPTEKNDLVRDHYEKMGFKEQGRHWVLPVPTYDLKPCYIERG